MSDREEPQNDGGPGEVDDAGAPASGEKAASGEPDPERRPARRKRRAVVTPPPRASRALEDAETEWSGDVARRLREGQTAEHVIGMLLEEGLAQDEIRAVFDGAAKILRAENAHKDKLYGAMWLVGGLMVTLVSYSAASNGGSYLVATGAIIYGAVRLVRGFSAG
jgi:hypothetical protein